MLLIVLGPVVGGSTAAWGEPPGRLDSQITDTVGALAGSEQQVKAALDSLQSDTGIQLWVAYESTFDGQGGQAWTDQTAQASGLGGNDLLFAVATEDRDYGWSAGTAVPLSDAQIEAVIAHDVEPLLAKQDWVAATLALADGLARQTAADTGPDAGGGSGSGPTDSGRGSGAGALLVGALIVVAGIVALIWWRRKRATSAAGGGPGSGSAPGGGGSAPASIEQLRSQAASGLVDADDAIKTSEQELGFAVAQFGDEAAAPFTAALAQSKQDLVEAFALHRQAQDHSGDPAERSLLDQVVALCRAADQRLDEQVDAFDALRDLERTVDTVLPGLRTRVEQLATRSAGAAQTMATLTAQWPPAALAGLGRHLEQAEQRRSFADRSVGQGTTLLSEGDRGGAVAHARAAEEAIVQAGELYTLVDQAPEILRVAQEAIAALMTETAKDVAEAERLGLPAEIKSLHTFASETLTWARTAVESGNYDPITARRALEESDNALEQGLVPLRAAEESRRRAEALLPTAIQSAESSIRVSEDFITTRRGAVGAEARSRLAEARRQLASGQVPGTDAVAALQQVQAADELADQALTLAQRDEARFQDSQQMRGQPQGGLGAVILGGILIDAMSRGGGFGGGGFGGGFGGSSGGQSGGGIRMPGPGSFGGSATRGRRGGGGRF